MNNLKTPTDQIIESLENEPLDWCQNDLTLNHSNGIEIWTSTVPYFDIQIWKPKRNTSLLEKYRLQKAVNRWHKKPLAQFMHIAFKESEAK